MEVAVLLQNQHPWPPTFCVRLPSFSANKRLGGRGGGAAGMPGWRVGRGLGGGWRTAAKRRRRRRWRFENGVLETEEEPPGLWEEFLDSMWFLKVAIGEYGLMDPESGHIRHPKRHKALGSYGWLLPLIILSWLSASGAKAFLMSFSLTLALSILTFLLKKLLQFLQTTTLYKAFIARNPPSTKTANDAQELASNDGSGTNIGAPSFGGWEDLIDEREVRTTRVQRPSEVSGERRMSLDERMAELKRRVEGEREMPLALRFLVAVFPFLSDWSELL